MSTVVLQLREIADSLTESLTKETIAVIKSQILSLADELQKQNATHLSHKDIDDILDEIDEKTDQHQNKNKNNEIMDEKEREELIFDIETVFQCEIAEHPVIRDHFDGKLDKRTWILLFHKPKNQDIAQHYPPPFGAQCGDITDQQLLKIYDAIRKDLKDDTEFQEIEENKFGEFAKWIIEYKKESDIIFDRIYDALIGYIYWSRLKRFLYDDAVIEANNYYEQYHKYIDVNQQTIDEGYTWLHLCGTDDFKVSGNMIKWLLSLKGINISIKDYNGKTAMDIAMESGKWIIVHTLTFATMSNKMREKSDEQIAKLNRNEGIIKQWFRFYNVDNKESDEYNSMIKMVESVKTLIKKRLPLSDDMLLLCFQFEMKQNKDDALKCSLWECLYNTLNEILRIPLNRRNWLWFKQYIFNSSLWFQKIPNNGKQQKQKLLYHLLIEMVSKQLKAQRDYLQPFIDKLEKKTDDDTKIDDGDDDDSWEKVKNYPEFIATDNPEGLRQDECIERGSNKELLPFPIRPIFNHHQLLKLSEVITGFNCENHWDVHAYLSKLVLTAHSLNKPFHETMRLIFNIDMETSENIKDGVKYLQGPVKRLIRSQAKAETDYSHCSYPTTAKIVDFIRCCLVYKNPKDLLNGIDKFVTEIGNLENKIPFCTKHQCSKLMTKCSFNSVCSEEKKKENTDYYCSICYKRDFNDDDMIYYCDDHKFAFFCIECGEFQIDKRQCLRKILRIKNMFLDNKRENGGKWDLYRYADIKMGVLMEYEGQSQIVEVQFLLHWMLKAKSLGHGLYEIERNAEFIFDVNKIRNLGSGDDDDVDKALRDAVSKGDENRLATLILNEAPVALMKVDDTKNGLLHYGAQHGHKKVIKFLLDTMQSDRRKEEFEEFINMRGSKGFTPLYISVKEKHSAILRLLLSYKEIDVNMKNEDNETALFQAVQNGDKKGKCKQIFDIIVKDDRCDLNIFAKPGINLFHAACCKCCNVNYIKKLWKTGYFKINEPEDKHKHSPLILAIQNHNTELVKFLLTIPDIDINYLDGAEWTAIDWAIIWTHKPSVELLSNRKDLNCKIGRNRLSAACMTGNVEWLQLVMKLWPDIDINGIDDDNKFNRTPIHWACQRTQVDALQFLLDLPEIKTDICDSNGYTPWLTAIKEGCLKNVKLLFNRKDINFNRKTVDAKNALDLAMEKYDPFMIKWLKDNGFTPSNNK